MLEKRICGLRMKEAYHIQDNVLSCWLRYEARQSSDEGYRVQETRVNNDLKKRTKLAGPWPHIRHAAVNAPNTIRQKDSSDQVCSECGGVERCDPFTSHTSKNVARCSLCVGETVDTTNTSSSDGEPAYAWHKHDQEILPDYIASENLANSIRIWKNWIESHYLRLHRLPREFAEYRCNFS